MSGADSSKKLASLLKRLRGRFGQEPEKEAPAALAWHEALVDELVYTMLLWEATSGQARNAFKRLKESYIDYNELRVSLPGETAAVLGERYPRGEERSGRLRAALFDLYKREFAVTLAPLASGAKRDVRAYLESLDGLPAFAVDRLMLMSFGGHAVPTDERLRDMLADEGVIDEGTPCEEAASWLSRQIKAEDALPTYRLLRAWLDEDSPEARKPKAAAAGDEARKPKPRADARPEGRADDKPGKRRAPARKKIAKGEE